jgi:hypothetical protein
MRRNDRLKTAATEGHALSTAIAANKRLVACCLGSVVPFFRRHRIIAALVSSVGLVAALGHHELAYLLLAVNYDKVFSAFVSNG